MFERKLWVRVHMGKSGLKPLLGTYKNRKHARDRNSKIQPDDKLVIGSNQFHSGSLPPIDGPADIDFLRNKCGWCMPTAEQVIKSQKLTVGAKKYIVTHMPPHIPSELRSVKSSENQKLQHFWQKHHFSSKTSDQLQREKLMSKITEELLEYERLQAYEATQHVKKNAEKEQTESKSESKFRHRASSFVRHKEIRTSEVYKISSRATTSFRTHLVIMEKKLSLQSKDDTELTKNVRSKLDKSKSLDRMEKLSKISKLETQRKKFLHAQSEITLPSNLETSNEILEDDYYKL